FRSAMAELITLLSQTGVYVVVLNGSTVVPDDVAHCYRDGEETPALIMHRLNAALMELAAGEGISILDADRVIAELGGEHHVTGLLSYSDVANDALCAELVAILNESGYLDGRARRAGESRTATGSALRLEMVAHTAAVRAGRVRRWRVAEGASFARGDGLVDIDVTEWSTLARRRTRPHMGPADERRDRLTFDAPRRPTVVHIVARERGVLARVTAPVGTPVAIGDLLGVVGVSEGLGPWASAPPPGGPTLQTGAVRFRERADRVEIDESRAASTPAPSPRRKAAVSHSTLYTRCKRLVPKPLRRRARSLLRRFREKPRHPGAAA
ncbi:MAG TPA: hypothetical protein VFX21_06035, partial [Acidimicrobiia bacterium]|nr:hypothetical protein [Acidimicrobiia bacterium]